MWNHISIIRKIKSMLPFRIKFIFIKIIYMFQSIIYSFFNKRITPIGEKNIYFLLSTDYSNLGDHAMSYASIKFLLDTYPGYEICEVTVNDTLKVLYSLKRIIRENDIICLKGGGNIGIEYFREELIRRKIIKIFNKNTIVIFPQTAYFPDTKLGQCELEKTINIYSENKKVLLFLRDRYSYELLHNRINNCYLVPDIVFYLGDSIFKNQKKEKYSVCLRRDIEGVLSQENKEQIIHTLKEFVDDVDEFDTIKDYFIANKDREKELKNIWSKVESSKLIITDRLHGMIFAYLLKTPCIVLGTYNYKLIGQYEWIKDSNSIYFCNGDINDLYKKIKKILTLKKFDAVTGLEKHFEYMKKIMKGIQ